MTRPLDDALSSFEEPLPALDASVDPLPTEPLCPVDRLPRRRRNSICIWIIFVGLLNFLIYTITYASVGGDAYNGGIRRVVDDDGNEAVEYIVRGHFIRNLEGREQPVNRSLWLYSYIHSITVPLTSGALIVSMLILARPHILATMRDGWFSGATFVTAFGTIVVVGTLFLVTLFTMEFVRELGKV
ncbi:MAG: hypothetical protein AB7N71_03430 [Phycisphaerae bacterium]